MDSSLYKEIIQEQIRNKHFYKTDNNAPRDGILIVIKDNKINEVLEGSGWVHPRRKVQMQSLITNVLKKYNLENCCIKINLSDIPKKGTFGFCRKKNDNTCFLLPNHRFTYDDIILDNKKLEFDNFNNQKEYIRANYKQNHINKIYTSSIPHKAKLDFFSYAINNLDICDGWLYTGSCHGKLDLSEEQCILLKNNNLAGDNSHEWIKHLDYKYVLYNDGNTLSDRMRLLLCTNSIIIYKSLIYEEFYTHKLKNRVNYVEYNNESEIRDIIKKNEETKEYEVIIDNNTEFVDTYLDYEQILLYTFLVIKGVCA
jgi:hypothetical protein